VELNTYSVTVNADPILGHATVDEGISTFSALFATCLPRGAQRTLDAARALTNVVNKIRNTRHEEFHRLVTYS